MFDIFTGFFPFACESLLNLISTLDSQSSHLAALEFHQLVPVASIKVPVIGMFDMSVSHWAAWKDLEKVHGCLNILGLLQKPSEKWLPADKCLDCKYFGALTLIQAVLFDFYLAFDDI